MKRIICMISVLAITFALVSCGKTDKANDTSSVSATTTPKITETTTSSKNEYSEPVFLDKSGENKICNISLVEQADGKLMFKSDDNAFEIECDYEMVDKSFNVNAKFSNLTEYEVKSDCDVTLYPYINCDKAFSFTDDLVLETKSIKANESLTKTYEKQIDDFLNVPDFLDENKIYNVWNDSGDNKVKIYYHISIIITDDEKQTTYSSEEYALDFILDKDGNIIS